MPHKNPQNRIGAPGPLASLLSVSTLTSFLLVIAGCASSPTPPTPGAAKDDAPLGLYARLVKQNGQYSVTGICWSKSLKLAADASKYPACAEPVGTKGALYFNLSTLNPAGPSGEVCSAWGGDGRKKVPPACDQYRDIYEADVGVNVVLSPLILIATVKNLGTAAPTAVKLDEGAFKREIEKALPTPQRLAIIEEERAWRQGAPERAQMIAKQRQVQAEAARRQQQARTDAFRSQIQQANLAASQKFQAAASAPKTLGATVCSADNRLGYIEQVAGARIRLSVKGRAVSGRDSIYAHGNPLGPFKLDTSRLRLEDRIGRDGANIEVPVLDPHYLFKPLPTVRIGPIDTGELWDDARYWGLCHWRV